MATHTPPATSTEANRSATFPVFQRTITVRDGARVSVLGSDDGSEIPTEEWDQFLTVAEIFDAIQRALTEGAASVRAEFDDALGYPRDVYIDVDERIADEERGYTVRNLQADP